MSTRDYDDRQSQLQDVSLVLRQLNAIDDDDESADSLDQIDAISIGSDSDLSDREIPDDSVTINDGATNFVRAQEHRTVQNLRGNMLQTANARIKELEVQLASQNSQIHKLLKKSHNNQAVTQYEEIVAALEVQNKELSDQLSMRTTLHEAGRKSWEADMRRQESLVNETRRESSEVRGRLQELEHMYSQLLHEKQLLGQEHTQIRTRADELEEAAVGQTEAVEELEEQLMEAQTHLMEARALIETLQTKDVEEMRADAAREQTQARAAFSQRESQLQAQMQALKQTCGAFEERHERTMEENRLLRAELGEKIALLNELSSGGGGGVSVSARQTVTGAGAGTAVRGSHASLGSGDSAATGESITEDYLSGLLGISNEEEESQCQGQEKEQGDGVRGQHRQGQGATEGDDNSGFFFNLSGQQSDDQDGMLSVSGSVDSRAAEAVVGATGDSITGSGSKYTLRETKLIEVILRINKRHQRLATRYQQLKAATPAPNSEGGGKLAQSQMESAMQQLQQRCHLLREELGHRDDAIATMRAALSEIEAAAARQQKAGEREESLSRKCIELGDELEAVRSQGDAEAKRAADEVRHELSTDIARLELDAERQKDRSLALEAKCEQLELELEALGEASRPGDGVLEQLQTRLDEALALTAEADVARRVAMEQCSQLSEEHATTVRRLEDAHAQALKSQEEASRVQFAEELQEHADILAGRHAEALRLQAESLSRDKEEAVRACGRDAEQLLEQLQAVADEQLRREQQVESNPVTAVSCERDTQTMGDHYSSLLQQYEQLQSRYEDAVSTLQAQSQSQVHPQSESMSDISVAGVGVGVGGDVGGDASTCVTLSLNVSASSGDQETVAEETVIKVAEVVEEEKSKGGSNGHKHRHRSKDKTREKEKETIGRNYLHKTRVKQLLLEVGVVWCGVRGACLLHMYVIYLSGCIVAPAKVQVKLPGETACSRGAVRG